MDCSMQIEFCYTILFILISVAWSLFLIDLTWIRSLKTMKVMKSRVLKPVSTKSGQRWERQSVKTKRKRKKRGELENRRSKRKLEREGGREISLFPLTSFLCSTALHAPFPSGQPGGQGGHRRPSFPSPCWPCWPFQTQSSSSGRIPARHGTKGGWTSSVWRPGAHSPSTQHTRRTEDSLMSPRRLSRSNCFQEMTQLCIRVAFYMTERSVWIMWNNLNFQSDASVSMI